jgi:riboflavin kinase / FMN adenylyltransferase
MAASGKFYHLRSNEEVPPELFGGILAIGNFDGVHLGHRAVLGKALALAKQYNKPSLAFTFEPHPRSHFRPDQPVFRLTPPGQKSRLIRQMGFDCLFEQHFDHAFSQISAAEFVEELLIGKLHITQIVTGENFHFGRNRQGTPHFLRMQAARYGVAVTQVQPYCDENGEAVSSTRIRKALASGNPEKAADLLGRPWAVCGTVIKGKQLGHTLGFPTANLALPPETGLLHGIYAVRVNLADGTRHNGVASFGRRPTFDNGKALLEAFLFDFSGDLYGQEIEIEFHAFLRQEEKFESADALIEQMNRDAAAARSILDKKN